MLTFDLRLGISGCTIEQNLNGFPVYPERHVHVGKWLTT